MTSSKDLGPSSTPFFPNTFIKNQFCYKPQWPPKDTNLAGKVAIITGANTGLGYESASQFLSFNLSRLILAVRSPEKGEAAAANLRTQWPSATVDVWRLDMASYESIQAFTRRVESELCRLDIVILNAGLSRMTFERVTSTGHEETIQINYLSTALLSILLLPVLKRKSPPGSAGRLTIVNSALALVAKLPDYKAPESLLGSFDDPKSFDPNDRYGVSKLLGQMFISKLVEYVSVEDVVVNLVDPGYVKGTGLGRDVAGLKRVGMAAFSAIAGRPMKVGGSSYLDAAFVKTKESHGCFIMNWNIESFNALMYTQDGNKAIEKLWLETMDELGFANVRGILDSIAKS